MYMLLSKKKRKKHYLFFIKYTFDNNQFFTEYVRQEIFVYYKLTFCNLGIVALTVGTQGSGPEQ